MQISKPEQLYDYLRMGLLPNLFNEPYKKAKVVPFLRPYQFINLMTNETVHDINEGFNRLIGIKITRESIEWIKNEHKNSQIVIPKLPISKLENNSTVFIQGNFTYAQALKTLENLNKSGWFQTNLTYSLSFEILTYNQNLKSGGFYRFKHYLNPQTGVFKAQDGRFQTIYPTSYDDLSDQFVLARLTLWILYTVAICFYILHYLLVIIVYYLKQLIIRNEFTMPWYYILYGFDYGLTIVSIYFWYRNFSQKNRFHAINHQHQYQEWTEEISISIEYFMIISPLALLLKSIKLLHLFEYYSPSFGLLFDSLTSGSKQALSFLQYLILLALPFSVMFHLISRDQPNFSFSFTSVSFLFFN